MAETRTLLSVSNIGKTYHKDQVIKGVNLDLKEGELFGLIGLNGVGKTTLIKIILDLIKASEGEAKVNDTNVLETSARNSLAYVPEKFQPSRYLTGFEFLELSVSYYGNRLDKDKAIELADQVALDPQALKRKVSSYSKGMGQKLGLLGACLTEQPLMILDEPMSGLDPKARIKLKQLMKDLITQGRTIFFSSHILSDIDEICDRIGVIHNQELRYVGTPADFKEQYQTDNLEQAFLTEISDALKKNDAA